MLFRSDRTAPTINGSLSPAANAKGWNNTDVNLSFTCYDYLLGSPGSAQGSGVTGCSSPQATAPLSCLHPNLLSTNSGSLSCGFTQTLSTEGAGQSVTATATDGVGFGATKTLSNINIDKTPPTCSVTAAWPNAVWVTNGKLIPISTQVTVNDALSGPNGFSLVSVTSNGQVSGNIAGWTPGTASTSGQVLATRTSTGAVQTYTLTYQGVDKAGNTTTCSTTVPHS